MRHAILHEGIRQSTKLAITSIKITVQDAGKVFAQQCEKDLTTTRFVNVEQRIVRRLKTPGPVLVPVILMAGFIHPQMRFIGQTLDQRIISGLKRLRDLLFGFIEHALRKRQAHHFFAELLDRRKGHVTSALHERNHRGHIGAQQLSLFDVRRQWRDMNRARPWIEVLPGPVFRNDIKLFRKCDLLYKMPIIQGFKAHCVLGTQFVFNDFVNLLRLKSGSTELSMSRLTSLFTFLAGAFLNASLRFNNVTRRGFRRRIRVLFKACDTLLELLDSLLEFVIFCCKLYDQEIFIVHAFCVTHYPQKRNCLS